MSEITILKDGVEVATAPHVSRILFKGTVWKGVDEAHCCYFRTLVLSPPITFRHLAGEALIKFLDHSSLVIGDSILEPMRYVHGRSEMMKGKHEVSAVLLAKIKGDVSPTEWMCYLPTLYRRFMSVYGVKGENP